MGPWALASQAQPSTSEHMPLIISKDPQTTTRQLGVNRVIEQRKAAVAPIESSGAPPEPAPVETPIADSETKAPIADPQHQVEIERRERALDAVRHEHELTKRELEQLKTSLQDPEAALRAAGYTTEKFVERWLNDGKLQEGAPPAAETKPAESELEKRIKQLEAERDQERASARARTRRQEIESMIPEGSEDFDVLRSLGAMDQFMTVLDAQERQRPGGLGPNEVKAMLSEFEGASRKNVTNQISQLAKSKFGRNLLAELLQKSSEKSQDAQQNPARENATEPPQSSEAESGYYRRSMELRGRTTEQLREAAKRKALAARGL